MARTGPEEVRIDERTTDEGYSENRRNVAVYAGRRGGRPAYREDVGANGGKDARSPDKNGAEIRVRAELQKDLYS